MKQFLFLFGLIACTSVQAADTTTIAKIHQGDWEANASLNARDGLDNFTTRHKNFGLGLQYFIWDHFSAGLEGTYQTYCCGYKGGSVAPVFTKYLFAKGRFAPYVSLLPIKIYSYHGERLSYASSARVGLKFFVTDNLAIGPSLEFERGWKPYDYTQTNLLGTISYHF